MKTITLKSIKYSRIPLEFDDIIPENIYNWNKSDFQKYKVYIGNTKKFITDYFSIDIKGSANNPNECTIVIDTNGQKIKYIGLNMEFGKIIVNGDADLHVGAQMKSGYIRVNGNAESYTAREMTGGTLEITGDVKEYCGSSYIGQWRGMSGGKIIVKGNAGKQLADCMVGGEIFIGKNVDILAGIHMVNGFIQINGDLGKWPAGQIKNGTILVKGHVDELLEGFILKEIITNPLINNDYVFGRYLCFTGDLSVKGKANIWINASKNKHLLE
ncbi:MAG: formylmethanofuran dehydrogenase subunit C [Methanobacteriaceae archaeon]|nr:formylmethanofuran dehydrogenase subunit C [Methanobacteriaceae archaeon]